VPVAPSVCTPEWCGWIVVGSVGWCECQASWAATTDGSFGRRRPAGGRWSPLRRAGGGDVHRKSDARLASARRISQSRCSQMRADVPMLKVRDAGRGVVCAVCEETTVRTFSRSALDVFDGEV